MARRLHQQHFTECYASPLDRRKSVIGKGSSEGVCMRLTITQLVLVCLCVALLVHLALSIVQSRFKLLVDAPSSQSQSGTSLVSSLLCDTWLLSDGLKSSLLTCPTSYRHSPASTPYNRLRANNGAVGAFFDDPLMVERWGDSESGEEESSDSSGLVLTRARTPHPQTIDDKWLKAEAVQALQAARRNRLDGNLTKAKVIIEHAYSLAPHHPDVLTEYGIFMESYYDNVVEAEGLYTKALHFNALHTEALIRKERTLPLVEEIDNRMLAEIHKKREAFLKIPRSDPGLRRAMRESYFQHVYHTVALEGNTMSLMQTRSILETRMAVAGKSIIEHNEILGMDAALRFLNQTLTHVGQIHLEDILQIHRRVMGFVDPMVAGVIRAHQVYVGSFAPTPPHLIPGEMDELIAWLNDEETLRIDPVELAALAHYKLVYIHPFSDGNGRTSRLLMNFILMQAGFPPVIIPVHERSRYYHALLQANEGDLRPFIRFIAEMTYTTLENFIATSSICEPSDCAGEERRSAELPPPSLRVIYPYDGN